MIKVNTDTVQEQLGTMVNCNNIPVYILLIFHKQKTAITYEATNGGMYRKQNTIYIHIHTVL